jgi:hypothetical protein
LKFYVLKFVTMALACPNFHEKINLYISPIKKIKFAALNKQ